MNVRMNVFVPLFCCIVFIVSPVFSESIFLKNGKIVEGKVVKENSVEIQVELPDHSRTEFARTNILRVIFHENYKVKKYILRMNGTIIEAYVVDEDKNNYYYRPDLNAPNEFRISKEDVDSISRRKVRPKEDDLVDENQRELKEMNREIIFQLKKLNDRMDAMNVLIPSPEPPKTEVAVAKPKIIEAAVENYQPKEAEVPVTGSGKYAPIFRLSASIGNGPSNDATLGSTGDLFLWRSKWDNGNGLDVITRGSYSFYDASSDYFENVSVSTNSARIRYASIGVGLLFSHSVSFDTKSLKGYILGYFEWNRYHYFGDMQTSYTVSGSTYKYTSDADEIEHSRGWVGGIGAELNMNNYLGLFIEYTNGHAWYTDSSRTHVHDESEGSCVRIGMNFNTQISSR